MNEIIKAYAHDFRGMIFTEEELEKILGEFWNETIKYLTEEVSNKIPTGGKSLNAEEFIAEVKRIKKETGLLDKHLERKNNVI